MHTNSPRGKPRPTHAHARLTHYTKNECEGGNHRGDPYVLIKMVKRAKRAGIKSTPQNNFPPLSGGAMRNDIHTSDDGKIVKSAVAKTNKITAADAAAAPRAVFEHDTFAHLRTTLSCFFAK